MNKKSIINIVLFILIVISPYILMVSTNNILLDPFTLTGVQYEVYNNFVIIICFIVFWLLYIYGHIKNKKFFDLDKFDKLLIVFQIAIILILLCDIYYMRFVQKDFYDFANERMAIFTEDITEYTPRWYFFRMYVPSFTIAAAPYYMLMYIFMFIWLLSLKKQKKRKKLKDINKKKIIKNILLKKEKE